MAGLGDLVQKAFYLGVGAASYAGEKAGNTVKDLQGQTQKLVNELVERGELTAEEAQQLLNKLMQRAQVSANTDAAPSPTESAGPRPIEIVDEEAPTATAQEADALRQQVDSLKQQLAVLKQKSSQ